MARPAGGVWRLRQRLSPLRSTVGRGRSRGGVSTAIHAIVEALGQLSRVRQTSGQAGDVPRPAESLDRLPVQAVLAVLANTDHDAAVPIEPLQRHGVKTVTPSHPTRKSLRGLDRDHYNRRDLSDRLFALSAHCHPLRQACLMRRFILRAMRKRHLDKSGWLDYPRTLSAANEPPRHVNCRRRPDGPRRVDCSSIRLARQPGQIDTAPAGLLSPHARRDDDPVASERVALQGQRRNRQG